MASVMDTTEMAEWYKIAQKRGKRNNVEHR